MMKRINIHLLYTLLYMVISILLISCNKIKNAKDKVADKLIEVLLKDLSQKSILYLINFLNGKKTNTT